MNLRVLQLGPVPPPEGGVSRNMMAIRGELVSRGDKCSIIATTRSVEESAADIHRPENALSLIRQLRNLEYDVLHLHIGGDISRRVQLLCLACTTFGKSPSVLTIHSGGFPLSLVAKNAQQNSFAGSVFRKFDHVIAVSEPIADVMQRFGVADDRLSVISPFAINVSEKRMALPTDLEEFSQIHTPLLVGVGGLEKDYDPIFQIEAMESILREYPNAGLIIVGDGSMRKAVEEELSSRAVGQHILLAGSLDHDTTIALMRRADATLRTTKFDGDATSVRESLSLGTPVVATDTGARPDGVCLYHIGDREGFIGALRAALTEGNSLPKSDDGGENIRAVLQIYEHLARR